jgi:exonuclease SbcC
MEIFDEIQTEDKNKVTTLFGEDSVVSDLFKEITGGFYKSVRLDSEGQKIQVERNDGEFFGAEQLSAGTYDQLYLSIRLSLGQKLLKGEKAFFIMDDPFIKSDKKRLERQMHILSKISQNGWQILYFSAKDEVKDALKDYIENGSVNLLETNAVAK